MFASRQLACASTRCQSHLLRLPSLNIGGGGDDLTVDYLLTTTRQASRHPGIDELDELFRDLTSEVPCGGGCCSAHMRSQLDGLRGRVGNLKTDDAAVPPRIGGDYLV